MSTVCVKCGEPLGGIPDETAAAVVQAITSTNPGSGRLCMACFALWRQANPPPTERAESNPTGVGPRSRGVA
jgi:hypothetical protein